MNAIFIVGSGRSGTNLLARLIGSYENIFDPLGGRENNKLLYTLAKSAIYHRNLPARAQRYYDSALKNDVGIFIDQHHPNLFFIDQLYQRYPNAIFIFPNRPLAQVVASMLRHDGVMAWLTYAKKKHYQIGRRLPFPNQFFGLQKYKDLDEFDDYMLCARRVIAHKQYFALKIKEYGNRLRVAHYEKFVSDPQFTLERLFDASELKQAGSFLKKEIPIKSSLTKYLHTLSATQIDELQSIDVVL